MRPSNRLRLTALLFLACAAAAPAAPDPMAVGLQHCLTDAAERENLSGSILVSRGDLVLARVYRGKLAGAGSAAIDGNTRFNLGSASKMFTAVAIGQLIDAGKLRLDEPIGEIVNGLTPATARVTIRQLLNHSSGLGDFFRPENMETMLHARSASDILPLIASDEPTFEPGTRFAYSNSGFALLGIAIERIAGMTYGAYLEHHVFDPAGMANTGLNPKPISSLAVGMTNGGMGGTGGAASQPMLIGPGGKPLLPGSSAPSNGMPRRMMLIGPDGRPIDPATLVGATVALRPSPGATEGYGSPAGGLFSTAEDMRRFALALMRDKLLSRAMRTALTSPQIQTAPATAERPARNYGFGFGVTDEGAKRWVGHNGGTLGANAEFSMQADDQWVVSVLSNRDPPVATNLMRRARSLIANPAEIGQCGRSGGNHPS